MTQEVDLEIDASKKDVSKDMLAYVLNEWDNYAVEEAIQIVEKFGGAVTAVTVGSEDDEEVLRRCLAMGAERRSGSTRETFHWTGSSFQKSLQK